MQKLLNSVCCQGEVLQMAMRAMVLTLMMADLSKYPV
jgi:hypothetical protein